VLTEAAISGKTDHLMGLKENVIIGKLIPARAPIDLPPRPIIEELRGPRHLLEDGEEIEEDLDIEIDDELDLEEDEEEDAVAITALIDPDVDDFVEAEPAVDEAEEEGPVASARALLKKLEEI